MASVDLDDAEWRARLWREMAIVEQAKGALMERQEIDDNAAVGLLALCAEQGGVDIVEAAARLK
ncbi:ANTAR domain-containing protein [Amycolatopsis umgeniensis]|uniref:AmiR/NasT family two-component response regulator n=1 Tax=Amycolatopsis umgeniensis TaxID=336628 RepID=A0A841AX80_9PSEU|nr:ANTAR domain-containing protein [Amycolatopsis umgeniensis]MBB5851251.1 AmiR/NasT family two-component response regulator [Amycolatopsis umgeniensis]